MFSVLWDVDTVIFSGDDVAVQNSHSDDSFWGDIPALVDICYKNLKVKCLQSLDKYILNKGSLSKMNKFVYLCSHINDIVVHITM